VGFFSDIKNAFNGKTRERYDFVVSSINKALSYKNFRERVVYGDKLSGEGKMAFFTFLTGYFTIVVQGSFMRTNKFDANIDEIHDQAFRLVKLYLKEELSWSPSYVDRAVREMREFAYQNPAGAESIMAIGSNVAGNLILDGTSAGIFNSDISEEKGYQILDDFFNML
jgi:hypothetical protein